MSAKKKTDYSIQVKTSFTNTRHFITQAECAEWLNIKNSSKKAIEKRCSDLGYEVSFDN
jgi:hypothetical protein